MRRFLPLLLCLSLSIFALARAMKPTDILVSCARGARQSPMKANTKTFLRHPITEQEPGSNDNDNQNDNDNTQDPSGNEGQEATNDGGDAAADQDPGDDDGADDADDDGGDSSSDNGGQ